MDPHTQFDDLARRKLDELHVPFEEGHWEAAQQLLQERRRRGLSGRWWSVLALLLLFGGGIAWWALRHTPGPYAEVHDTPSTTPLASATASHAQTTPAQPLDARTAVHSASEDVPSLAAAVHHATRTPTPTLQGTDLHPRSDRAIARDGALHRTSSAPLTAASAPTPLAGATPIPASETPASYTHAALAPANADKSETIAAMAHTGAATEASDPLPEDVAFAPAPLEAMEPAAPTAATPSAPTHAPMNPTADEAVAAALESPSDSTAQDEVAAQLDPLLADAVPRTSPWELGILAGPGRSTSRYAGGFSEAWQDGLTPERTVWLGAEAMRMGRHFGWGTGLHYGSYRERLSAQELSSTSTAVRRSWSLVPVDTNILVVGDTVVVNGQTYYAGQTVATTINVLTSDYDTTFTTTLRRAARQSSNRVSYLEVPLLLDAHLVQGRWHLGVRGGPTIGLLTGRRGSLPNSNNDGYTDLGDAAFREVVFGWTARAYLRYRFNAGWSVGVEPMLRGQFGNALQQDDLSRRSSALGGVVSLSYRLK